MKSLLIFSIITLGSIQIIALSNLLWEEMQKTTWLESRIKRILEAADATLSQDDLARFYGSILDQTIEDIKFETFARNHKL